MHQNKFVYSPIVAIPHETNNNSSQFVEIETSSGNKLQLTRDHFIPIMKSTDVAFGLINAKEVSVGDTVITVNGRETVTSVSNIDREGMYTVITLEEFIVVNNVVASPYAVSHFLANVYYSIHKVLYKTNPDIVKHQIFGKINKHAEQFYSKTIGIYKNLVKAQ
jgi:intein/homing endonuclease